MNIENLFKMYLEVTEFGIINKHFWRFRSKFLRKQFNQDLREKKFQKMRYRGKS